MNRTHFLTLATAIALVVGAGALLAPTEFLATKVCTPTPPPPWDARGGRGAAGLGVMALRLRRAPDSTALRAFMLGNAGAATGAATH